MDKIASAPEKESDNLEDNNNITYPATTAIPSTVVDL
jgi:hypothetical protein